MEKLSLFLSCKQKSIGQIKYQYGKKDRVYYKINTPVWTSKRVQIYLLFNSFSMFTW